MRGGPVFPPQEVRALSHFLDAMQVMLQPSLMLIMLFCVACGLVVGAIPGLSATMAMALLTPLTFAMDNATSMAALCAIYVGGISGGLYSAILLRIPGTSSSIATTFDGFPLARKGRAAQTIGIALVASFIGGTFSFVMLGCFAPLLAMAALQFGPAEYFAVSLLGLSTIAAVLGDSTLKGLVSATLGLALGTIGMDVIMGTPRFTAGSLHLMSGFDFMAVLIGVFAIPQILADIANSSAVSAVSETKVRDMFPRPGELLGKWGNFLRSSIIGTWIGLLPGAGGSIASLLSYDQAKKASKHPENFGKGEIDGVIASETANNAVIGGSLIPMLTLGIPGDTAAAVLLAALTLHGLQVGPLLFKENPEVISEILASLYVSNIMMIFIAFFGARYIVKALKIPKCYLLPAIVVMCVVGSYAANQRQFDIFVMMGTGLAGFLIERYGFPVPPLILGLILGPLLEKNLRRAIQVSNEGVWGIISRPLTAVILLVVVLNFCLPLIRAGLKQRRAGVGAAGPDADGGSPPDPRMRRANRILGAGIVALAAGYYLAASFLPVTVLESPTYGPSFYPRMLALCLGFLGLLVALFPHQKGDRVTDWQMDRTRLAVKAVLMVLYPVLAVTLGFYASTALYLAACFIYFGGLPGNQYWKGFSIAAAGAGMIWVVFEWLLEVLLPGGLLF